MASSGTSVTVLTVGRRSAFLKVTTHSADALSVVAARRLRNLVFGEASTSVADVESVGAVNRLSAHASVGPHV
jgi:hypothetical protein